MIVFTPANFPPNFVDNSDDEHYGHGPPLFIRTCAHSDDVTNVEDVQLALLHFEGGVTLVIESLVEIKLGNITNHRFMPFFS